MTSPGTVARKALPCLERSSGAAIDPVTAMTVSSSDWLIFSVISDSFLTLKSRNRDPRQCLANRGVPQRHQARKAADFPSPLEAFVDCSTLCIARRLVPPISYSAAAAGCLRTKQFGSPLNLQETEARTMSHDARLFSAGTVRTNGTRAPGRRRPRCT
jgi:hypothetical protein